MEPQSGLTPVETPISPKDCVKKFTSNCLSTANSTTMSINQVSSTHDTIRSPQYVQYSFTSPTYFAT